MCKNIFPDTLATSVNLLSSIRVSHKLDSGTELNVSTMRPETGADCGLWLKLDRGVSSSWALAQNSEISRKSDISGRILQTRLLPFKTAEVSKKQSVHCAWRSQFRGLQRLGSVRDCKQFFRISLWGSVKVILKAFFTAFLSLWLECGRLETTEIRRNADDWKHWPDWAMPHPNSTH